MLSLLYMEYTMQCTRGIMCKFFHLEYKGGRALKGMGFLVENIKYVMVYEY